MGQWTKPWEKTHSKVDAEHMWVTVRHLKNTLHTLTK